VHIRILKFGIITLYQIISPEAKFKSWSVRNKLSYVEDIATESSIICVTESHLDTNIIDNDILIDGYRVFKVFPKCSHRPRWSVNSAY
jgi:hypothetical protein